MTTNDLKTYSAASDYLFLAEGVIVAVTMIIMALVIIRDPRRKTITVAVVSAFALVAAALVSTLVLTHKTEQAAAHAGAVNAKMLQSWAETAYGVSIDDRQAGKAMKAWGSNTSGGLQSHVEPTFEAEGPEGDVLLVLTEKEDGSFQLIQTERVLEPAGGAE